MLAEWLKSVVPFGGFPWGAVGFSSTDSPLLVVAHFGGAPLVSFVTVLTGFARGDRDGVRAVVATDRHLGRNARRRRAGACIVVVLLVVALSGPHVRQSGVGAGDE